MANNQPPRQSYRKNTNIISTRKILRVNKRENLKLAQIETTTFPPLTAGHPSTSINQKETFTNQSVNHKQYSARNSLRAAKTIAANDKGRNSETLVQTMTMAFPLAPQRGVEDASNYYILDADCFFKFSRNDSVICFLCGIRIDHQAAETHSRSDIHKQNYSKLKSYLTTIPPADNSLQMFALNELLTDWYRSYSLTSGMVAQRLDIIDEFVNILRIVDPECQIRLLGSMSTSTSLINSDINLELLHPNSGLFEADPRSKNSIHHKLIDPNSQYGSQINNHTVHYDLIPNAFDTLYQIKEFISIECPDSPGFAFEVVSTGGDLNSKIPKLILLHKPSRIFVELICYAGSSYKLSLLLGTYLSLDDRASVLATLIKYWSKHCKLDNPNLGTYPPDAFIILVIYYLQRTSPPILPCLHEMLSRNNKKVELARYNANSVPTESMQNLDLQDRLHDKDDASAGTFKSRNKTNEESADNNAEVVDDEEEDGEVEDDGCFEIDSEFVKNLDWTSKNDTPVHKLFIDFFFTMIGEFNDTSNIISIRTLEKVKLTSKEWNTSIKAIENPVLPRINMSRCIGTFRTFEYMKTAMEQCYYYLTSFPLDSKLKPKSCQSNPADYFELYINLKRFASYCMMKEDSIQNESDHDLITQMIKQELFARDVEVHNVLSNSTSGNLANLPKTVANFFNKCYLLPQDISATRFCWLCKKTGHSRVKCPTWKIDKSKLEIENYDIELDTKANFDLSFLQLYEQESISPQLSRRHERIVRDLTEIIKSAGINCQLQLFGSIVNDLGSRDSDLDICMTLEGDSTGKDVDCVDILTQVNAILSNNKRVNSLESILSARVPILKFKFDQIDVDLSMYNLCALHNSKLLKTYARFDKRVAQLSFLVKRYAKCCGIADASKGCLSSYAWTLLVIHYLQHTSPPILPVLQECGEGEKKPLIGVCGWNVWFNNDVKSYKMQENNSSLTQLFKGFFLYYGNFDFSRYVVSIRKSTLITRYRKNWNHCMMAIEGEY